MKKTLIFILILSGAALFTTTKVSAATISPDKYYLDASVTSTTNHELKVYGDPRLVGSEHLYIYPFGMKKIGEENDREFYLPSVDELSEPANWIDVKIKEIDIKSGDIIKIPWSLTPSNLATCGTNIAAILVSSTPQSEALNQSAVGIHNHVVAQIHIDINKTEKSYCEDSKVNLDLLDFYIDSNFHIFNYDNIPFITRIKNNGDIIAQKPKGFIEIFGFGPKITIPFNDEDLDIYPNSIRKFKNTWIDKDYPANGTFFEQLIYEIAHFRFGQYEAKLGITKNVNTAIVDTETFWIIPWKIVLIVGIILFIFWILLSINRRKQRELDKLKKSKVKVF